MCLSGKCSSCQHGDGSVIAEPDDYGAFIPSPENMPYLEQRAIQQRQQFEGTGILGTGVRSGPSKPKTDRPRQRLIEADGATRKGYPMARGLLDYFPDALAEVSRVSFLANEKHNPGEEMHHARGKSMDHADCIVRHLVGRGGFDGDTRESAALAWRALALLQEELEREHNLALPRNAR